MPRPLSIDIRERALARLVRGESIRTIAEALDIAPSSVVKWSQRYRQTGSVAPAKLGGNRPRLIVGAHGVWLRARIARDRPFTLRSLADELAARGLQVDTVTLWRWLRQEGWSFKKKRSAQRAG